MRLPPAKRVLRGRHAPCEMRAFARGFRMSREVLLPNPGQQRFARADKRVTESHPRCSSAATFLGTRPPPARIWRMPAAEARHPEPRRERARAAARAVA